MVKLYLFRKNLERNETLLEDRVTLPTFCKIIWIQTVLMMKISKRSVQDYFREKNLHDPSSYIFKNASLETTSHSNYCKRLHNFN